MRGKTNKRPLFLGAMLIALGILINKWFLEFAVTSDGQIEGSRLLLAVYVFQIVSITLGTYLVLRRPVIRNEYILLASSIVVTLLILEFGARLWLGYIATTSQQGELRLYTEVSPEDFRWTRHHYLNYYPTPNFRSGLTYHNSLGYRNREIPLKKPSGVYRIVALGGSTTYTSAVKDNEKTYPAQLEMILRDKYHYRNVEVINAGVNGYSSWESLINLEFRVLDLEPDLIIVYHGTNDVHTRLVQPTTYLGDNTGLRQQWTPPPVPIIEYSTLIRIVSRNLGFTEQVGLGSFVFAPRPIRKISSDKQKEVLKENPPVYFRRNLQNMIAVAKEHDVKIMFATWAYSPFLKDYASTDHYQYGFKENNDVVKDVAHSHNIPLFDFAELMPRDPRYWRDGRHVNEEGALLKAELFAQFIDEAQLITGHQELERLIPAENSAK